MNVDTGSLFATKRQMCFRVCVFDRELQTSWGGGFGVDEVGREKIDGTIWTWVCCLDISNVTRSNVFYSDLLDEYGVRLNIIGKTELVRKAEDMTRHNYRYVPWASLSIYVKADLLQSVILNLCMPYASRDQITTAVQSCIRNANSQGSEEPYAIRLLYNLGILQAFCIDISLRKISMPNYSPASVAVRRWTSSSERAAWNPWATSCFGRWVLSQ